MKFLPYAYFARKSVGFGLSVYYDWSYGIKEFSFDLRLPLFLLGFSLEGKEDV